MRLRDCNEGTVWFEREQLPVQVLDKMTQVCRLLLIPTYLINIFMDTNVCIMFILRAHPQGILIQWLNNFLADRRMSVQVMKREVVIAGG